MKNKRIELVPGMTCPVCGAADKFSVNTWWRMLCVNCGARYENATANCIVDEAEILLGGRVCSDDEVLVDDDGYHHENVCVDFGSDLSLDSIYSIEGGDSYALPYN